MITYTDLVNRSHALALPDGRRVILKCIDFSATLSAKDTNVIHVTDENNTEFRVPLSLISIKE